MKKKILLISVAMLLSILFLSTVGSFYTGNVILKSKDASLNDYPYPFIKNNIPNSLYIVVPDNLDDNYYKAAEQVAMSLKGGNPLPPKVVNYNNIPEGEHNLILIGNPCSNEAIAVELNTRKCSLYLNKGQGIIKLINHEKTGTIILSGYSSSEVLKTAHVISNYNFYPLLGKEMIVTGNIGSLILNYN